MSFDSYFNAVFRALWTGVLVILWIFKAIFWLLSFAINRREMRR